jgi:tetratricopeptide (TPR) repeat protein
VEAAIEAVDAATPAKLLANLELSRARLALDQGEAEVALAAAERGARHRPADDVSRALETQLLIGMSLVRSERVRDGEIVLREALEAASASSAKHIIPSIMQALATVQALNGDFEAARTLSWDALRLHRAAGCERLAARDAPNLAETEFAAGNPESALQLALEAAAVFRAQSTWTYLGWTLGNASVYLMALQRFDEAREYANEALRLGLESGNNMRAIWAMQHLAVLDEDHVRAAHLLGFVDERLSQSGVRREFTERYSYERLRKTLETALGERLDELVAEGRTWSEDRAFAEALEIL